MGIGDFADKAKNSGKAEDVTDKGLDSASDAAGKAGGGKFADQAEKGRDAADKRIGNE